MSLQFARSRSIRSHSRSYIRTPLETDSSRQGRSFPPEPYALGLAQSMAAGQRRVDRVDKRPELRWFCFDIDSHGEVAERGGAHRADRSDERSAKALF